MPDLSVIPDAFKDKDILASSPYVVDPKYTPFGHLNIRTKESAILDTGTYSGTKQMKAEIKTSQNLERHFVPEEGNPPTKVTQSKNPSPKDVFQASERKRKSPETLDSGNNSTKQRKNIDGENMYDSDSDDKDINCRALTCIKVMKNSTF